MKTTLLDVHTMNARAIEEEDILSVTVYFDGGDSWMEFSDVAEAIAIQTILRISGSRLYGTIPDNLPA